MSYWSNVALGILWLSKYKGRGWEKPHPRRKERNLEDKELNEGLVTSIPECETKQLEKGNFSKKRKKSKFRGNSNLMSLLLFRRHHLDDAALFPDRQKAWPAFPFFFVFHQKRIARECEIVVFYEIETFDFYVHRQKKLGHLLDACRGATHILRRGSPRLYCRQKQATARPSNVLFADLGAFNSKGSWLRDEFLRLITGFSCGFFEMVVEIFSWRLREQIIVLRMVPRCSLPNVFLLFA